MRMLIVLAMLAAPAEQLGTLRFETSGKPEAQAAFLRGVAALHSFWYEEARDSFIEAQKADPGFALAWWGEAMTYNHPIWMEVDLEAGRKALQHLGDTREARLAKAPTPRERAYLEAVETLYFGEGEKADRDRAYEAAMARLVAAHPDDTEAKTFYALSILGTMRRGEPDARKQIRAAAVLEPLLAANPDHPGLLHYMIHAYDDPVHAPLGLRAARRYAEVAPAAHHALHMPSHIFLQLGMWDEAARSNEEAYAASKAWVERKKLARAKRDLHSLSWLQYVYLQQGRNAEAKKLIDEVAFSAQESERERTTRQSMLARYAIEANDWASYEFGPPPAAGVDDEHVGCATMTYSGGEETHFAAGLQALSRGDLKAVDVAIKNLAAERAKKKGPFARTVEVMERELEALALSARGKTAAALEKAARAAEIEDTLGAPSGPPDVYRPAHEVYGELLLKAGKREEAAEQFRIALLRTPNRAAAVAGMQRASGPQSAVVQGR